MGGEQKGGVAFDTRVSRWLTVSRRREQSSRADPEEVGAYLNTYQLKQWLGAELARERQNTSFCTLVKLYFPDELRRKGETRFGHRQGARTYHLQGPIGTV